MAEQKIILFNKARKEIGNIILNAETVDLTTNFNEEVNAEILSAVQNALKDGGVKVLVASTVKTSDGKTARVQKPETVTLDNPKFMAALADKINRIINPKAPVFAVLQKTAKE